MTRRDFFRIVVGTTVVAVTGLAVLARVPVPLWTHYGGDVLEVPRVLSREEMETLPLDDLIDALYAQAHAWYRILGAFQGPVYAVQEVRP